jgi:DNA-binding NarL/FixJ family response regulator
MIAPFRYCNRAISLIIADDHPVVREGLKLLIEDEADMTVIATTGSGAEAVSLFEQHRPSITLMDLKMPGLDGVNATKRIRSIDPKARIVVLTSFSGDVQASRAFVAGASGFLLKDSLRSELIASIRTVLSGRRWIPSAVANELGQHFDADVLTNRELEVLTRISNGASNKEIATSLGLSEETIKSYVKNLIAKLRANDRTHAVTIALRRGYLDI